MPTFFSFAGRGCHVVSVTDSYGQIRGFLDRSPHEAEWAPFQTHYFSENLVAPGIEPETFESVARNSYH
jgi:hypothetical protein